MNRKESGVLLLKKPGRMRWTYTDPDGKLFVLDGKDGYFYSPGESEAQKVDEKKLDDLRSPCGFCWGYGTGEGADGTDGDAGWERRVGYWRACLRGWSSG